jgi:uncharacterized protein
MRKQTFKPRRLDVEAFARAGQRLEGRIALDALPRLAGGVAGAGNPQAPWADWQVEGWLTQPLAGEAVCRLKLSASAVVELTCQRCLQPLTHPVTFTTTLRFAADEDAAQALDEASDDEDVLALTRALDLQELVEDELIMALPLIPRHGSCSLPAAAQADAVMSAPGPQPGGTRRPLAALGAMLAGSGKAREPDSGASS